MVVGLAQGDSDFQFEHLSDAHAVDLMEAGKQMKIGSDEPVKRKALHVLEFREAGQAGLHDGFGRRLQADPNGVVVFVAREL